MGTGADEGFSIVFRSPFRVGNGVSGEADVGGVESGVSSKIGVGGWSSHQLTDMGGLLPKSTLNLDLG